MPLGTTPEEKQTLLQRVQQAVKGEQELSATDRATLAALSEDDRVELGRQVYRATFVCNICEEVKRQKKNSLTE